LAICETTFPIPCTEEPKEGIQKAENEVGLKVKSWVERVESARTRGFGIEAGAGNEGRISRNKQRRDASHDLIFRHPQAETKYGRIIGR
jgi:hypothetical protein